MTKLTLGDFAAQLDRLAAAVARDLRVRKEDLRPFVCRGSPIAAAYIFVVGVNPASSDGAFWRHWSPTTGFDYDGWFAEYQSHRLAQGKKRVSPTRRRINLFVDGVEEVAGGVTVIETNLYPVGTPRKALLAPHNQDSRLFDFLLEALEPAVIVAHGKDARESVGRHFGHELDDGAEVRVGRTLLRGFPSFSGMGAKPGTMSDTIARAAGRELALRVLPRR